MVEQPFKFSPIGVLTRACFQKLCTVSEQLACSYLHTTDPLQNSKCFLCSNVSLIFTVSLHFSVLSAVLRLVVSPQSTRCGAPNVLITLSHELVWYPQHSGIHSTTTLHGTFQDPFAEVSKHEIASIISWFVPRQVCGTSIAFLRGIFCVSTVLCWWLFHRFVGSCRLD